ncbi:MAG: nucleotide-binding universal stress UspA family protein [Cyclobacteriaceae bacterium]|jgi:nucleotide-binding universal stress UspA family protein
MKNILVPTDFSGYADFAIASAARFAHKVNGNVKLFHVVDEVHKIEIKADEQLKLIEESGIMDGIKYDLLFGSGDPIESIVSEPADLIIMGSHVVTGVKGFFTHTNAEKVAKQAVCPVITLKQFTDLSSIQTIVYPTDMKSEQSELIPEVKFLQELYQAKIHLVKVFQDTVANEKGVLSRLEAFALFHGLSNYEVHSLPGMDESEEIGDFAEKINADMILMATHERHGLEKLIGGFISGSLLKESLTAICTKVVDHG